MKLIHADCIEAMSEMDEASVDAIVTDPPYGLGFMGKKWDDLPPGPAFAEQALRVLKPGGHLLAFGGTRTYHRLAVAIEDAGFEIRDCLMWLYGSGFPKSLDVSKAIDKAAGAEREVVGSWKPSGNARPSNLPGHGASVSNSAQERRFVDAELPITAPATDAAKEWEGWGTALKPAHEPIVLARKPLEGTVAANVQKWGTGGLNIDESRIGTETISTHNAPTGTFAGGELDRGSDTSSYREHQGRWPANLAFDETAAAMLDEQSGERPGMATQRHLSPSKPGMFGVSDGSETKPVHKGFDDTGGASRFFYCAKASKSERNAGLRTLPAKITNEASPPGTKGSRSPRAGANRAGATANHHPTVKPISLMRWLVRLVTPPNGTVLDPFLGSGTTGCAAAIEGFDFIGIEREAEYLEIAQARIDHWRKQPQQESLV